MKTFIILLFAITLLLNCSKEVLITKDNKYYLISKTWMLDSMLDGDFNANLDCIKDNTIIFNDSNSAFYYYGLKKCDLSETEKISLTYSLTSDQKNITMPFDANIPNNNYELKIDSLKMNLVGDLGGTKITYYFHSK